MVFLGDIHCKFNVISERIDVYDIHDTNIIQVGDFGIGFNSDDMDRLGKLNEELKQKNIHLWVIRGNHDDPSYFDGSYMNYFSNIHFVPDYTVLELEEHKILFVGGAVSVDRVPLIKETNDEKNKEKGLVFYFEDEVFKFDEEKIKSIEGVDIIVTHTCPTYCFPDSRFGPSPFVLNYAENDANLLKDLDKERNEMTKMFDMLSKKNFIDRHYYGHYHRGEITMNLNTNHYCLGVNEMREI